MGNLKFFEGTTITTKGVPNVTKARKKKPVQVRVFSDEMKEEVALKFRQAKSEAERMSVMKQYGVRRDYVKRWMTKDDPAPVSVEAPASVQAPSMSSETSLATELAKLAVRLAPKETFAALSERLGGLND